jgi:iron(III) transport system substrate-binding protein
MTPLGFQPCRAATRRAAVALAAGLMLAATVAGCGSASAAGGAMVLYNGQHPQLTQALVSAFTRQTGIHVTVRTDDGIVLADQLLQEGTSSPADVYLAENSPELMELEEHGLLAKLSPAILDQIPAGDDSPAGEWTGIALRVGVLVYDPPHLPAAQRPRSVLELAQPQWKGRIAIAPADSDFPPIVGAVLAQYGRRTAERWLAGLKRNAQIFQTDEAVVAAVNRGAVVSGLINHYCWYRLRVEVGTRAMHSSLYFFSHHDAGSVVNVSGAAILASSRRRADAEAFLRFLVSRTGQRIVAHGYDFEYPARPGIAPNPALPPLSTVSRATFSATALGNDEEAAQLIQDSGLA